MQVIYGISSIILFILTILLPKSEEKQGIVEWLNINFIVFLCYNSIIAIVLSIFKIQISLMNLSLVNGMFIVSELVYMYLYKSKQDYYFDLKEFFMMFCIIVTVVFVGLKLYSIHMYPKFETTDPTVHYVFSKEFARNNSLLFMKNNLMAYKDAGAYPFLTYLNTGIIFEVFGKLVEDYKLYTIFNLVLVTLTTNIFYLIIKSIIKKTYFVLDYILCLVFVLGYILNSVIFGFSSLLMGILIILLMILLLSKYLLTSSKLIMFFIIVSLIGVFYSYYYFIPEILMAVFLILMYKYLTHDKYSIVKSFVISSLLLIPVVIFGALFLFYFKAQPNTGASGLLNTEGYIYRDLYSSFIIFLSIGLYGLVVSLKEKTNYVISSVFICSISFTLFLFILGIYKKASSYYFFKNHYLIQCLLLLLFSVGIYRIAKENRILFRIYCVLFSLLVVTNMFVDDKIHEKRLLFNPEPKTSAYIGIYNFNISKINNMEYILDGDELKVINKLLSEKDTFLGEKQEIPVIGDTLQLLWFYSMTNIWPEYDKTYSLSDLYKTESVNYNKWINDPGCNYVILFKRNMEKWINENNFKLEKFDIIYQSGNSYILKKIK